MITLLFAASLLTRAQPALDAVRPAAISAHVRFLSDDLLEGRYAGSRGHEIAERYVQSQLASLGISGSLQAVPLVQVQTQGSTFSLSPDALFSGDGRESRDLEGDLAFVEYGLGKLPDLHGKIAVVYGSAPPSMPALERAIAASNPEKQKRLAAAGAIAEIILTPPELEKKRPWSLIQRNFRNGQTYVADDLPPMPSVAVPFELNGRVLAEKHAKIHLVQQARRYESHNVIGILPGESPETLVYSAHLDHHGICEPGAADPICNGAIDNATGVAEVLEIARGFAALQHRERSVMFLFVTAEELGLHGSAWFARHPTIPPSQMIANLNFDQLLPAGPVREIVLRGAELSSLEDSVRKAADILGIQIGPDPVPEETFYARSDQLSFARIGVPSACLWQGFGGSAPYEAAYRDFRANRYHKPSDEWTPAYDGDSAAQMSRFELLVGISLLTDPKPAWKSASPFQRR
jgi:hypothetical protein